MEEKKTNLFLMPFFSFVPTKYRELVKNKSAKIFGAIIITFLVIGIIQAFRISNGFNYVISETEGLWPDFSISNEGFSVNQPINYADSDLCFAVDDSIADVTEQDIKELVREYGFSVILIMGKDSFGIYSNGRAMAYNYSDFPKFSFTKDTLFSSFLPKVGGYLFAGVIIFYLFYVALYYFAALIMSLFTYLVCVIFKKDTVIPERDRFQMTVLAKLPVYIVVLIINTFVTGVHIKIGWAALLVIAYTAVIVCLYDKDKEKPAVSLDESFGPTLVG